MINILVTGAGGGVGQGIIKSLKMIADLDIRIIAADMSEFAIGLYAGAVAQKISKCNSEDYLESLSKIFIKHNIDYYFPGTDVELLFCAKNKNQIKENWGVHTVISSSRTIEISDDKFKTSQFLKANGLNYPKTFYMDEYQGGVLDFPLIVKPAVGCRSIGVFKVNSQSELDKHKKYPEGLVVQECVGTEDTEYTCTVVKAKDTYSPVLALKRVLRSGDTYRAEPVKSVVIEEYVRSIAEKLEIDGGCNFQLRIDSTGVPKLFEINSRFSGTTPFCAQLGFNAVEFYLKHSAGIDYKPVIDYDSVVLRHWSEIVIKKSQIDEFNAKSTLAPNVSTQFNLFGNSK